MFGADRSRAHLLHPVMPAKEQGGGILLSMARADGLAVVPADSAGLTAGSMVTVQLLNDTVFQDDAGFRE